MKRGFTLVELSIVLVIIGLLIGGILVAQSMIGTAKLQSTVKQLQQLDIAVDNFKTKFNYLPADAPTYSGDGDGYITSTECSTGWFNPGLYQCQRGFNGEIGRFWNNLSDASFGNFANCSAGCSLIKSGTARNVPTVSMGQNSVVVALSMFISTGWSTPAAFYGKPFFFIINSNVSPGVGSVGNDGGAATFTPAEAYTLDLKIDDGIPAEGNYQVGSIGGMGEFIIGINNTPSCLASLTAYNLTNSGVACAPVVMFKSYQ